MSKKTIKLATNLECLAQPCFIVEREGVHYVAVAVLEYDMAETGGNQEKINGVNHVKGLFKDGYQNAPLAACQLNDDGSLPPKNGGQAEAFASGSPQGPGGPGGPGGPRGPGGPGTPVPPPPPPPPPPGPSEPPGIQTDPPGVQTSP